MIKDVIIHKVDGIDRSASVSFCLVMHEITI
jgi:hypothetical protein